jgi:hypothetical protein
MKHRIKMLKLRYKETVLFNEYAHSPLGIAYKTDNFVQDQLPS